MLPEKIKLPFRFDAKGLQGDLQKVGVDWIDHFVKQNYEGDWSVIPLRGPKGAKHPVQMIFSSPSAEEFDDTPFLKPCLHFQEVINSFDTYVTSVRLMKLGAGATIKEHRDYDLDEENGIVRLHIPVITNDKVEFFLNQQIVSMNAGECWYLRLSDPHMVFNRGNSDRIHLVLDMQLNDWLKMQLIQS
jgi:hypothetical protein